MGATARNHENQIDEGEMVARDETNPRRPTAAPELARGGRSREASAAAMPSPGTCACEAERVRGRRVGSGWFDPSQT